MCSDMLTFKRQYWLLGSYIIFSTLSNDSIIIFVSDLLQVKFRLDQVTAGALLAMIALISGLIMPIIGWFIDSYGYML